MMIPISVMLVDDNPTFLRVAAQFLEAHEDMTVVGTAGGGEQALTQAKALRPQIILIDLAMPDLPGLKVIPRLREMLPDVGIVALTVMNTKSFQAAALKAGANAFIPKAAMRTELLPVIRQIAQANGKVDAEAALDFPGHRMTLQRILVMEDNRHLRRLYSKALSAAGYDVHPAKTLQEARDLLAQMRFDLLICDIFMGSERGTDLLDEYADTLFTSGAQVVMVSGQSQYRSVCQEMGADFFLEKPIAISTLVALADRLTARENFTG